MVNQKVSIHHVSLVVENVEVSRQFYCEVLGLSEIERPVMKFGGAWLDLGRGQQLHLLELDNPDPVEGRPQHGGRDRHLALAVEDLKAFRKQLDAAGIVYTDSASGREALFCRDPDGNAVELIQR